MIGYGLKVLSYWNLNRALLKNLDLKLELKVLSYWNLNNFQSFFLKWLAPLKYYHIGI